MIIGGGESDLARWQVMIKDKWIKDHGFDVTDLIMPVFCVWAIVSSSLVSDAFEDHFSLDQVT